MTPRELFDRYAAALAYVAVEKKNGDQAIGTAFHVGSGIFVTARHVLEGNRVLELATTESRYVADPSGNTTIAGRSGRYRLVPAGKATIESGFLFHPDDTVDVAALMTEGLDAATIPLGSHLDDWINDEAFMLAPVVVMGYPRIPFSKGPKLVAARGEVNAVVDKYNQHHPHFVISTMARGGFSGGPCLVEWDFALGLVTEALLANGVATELGYMAVLTVEPIFACLQHHGIVPAAQKEGRDGLWD